MNQRSLQVMMCVCVLCACCFRLGAAIASENTLPKLETTTMSLSGGDLKELLEKLGTSKEDNSEKQKVIIPPPPCEYILGRAHYSATAVSGSSVLVEASMDIEILKQNGWVSMPILKNTVAPLSVSLDDEPKNIIETEKGWLSVILDKTGRHTLKTIFYAGATSSEGLISFEFDCIRTPITQMTLTIQDPAAVVEAPNAVNVSTERTEDRVCAELTFRSTDKLAVQWRIPAATPQQETQPPPEIPRLISLVSTLASVSDRYIACESLLRYEVQRGSADVFRFNLPRNASILNVVGQGAVWNTTESNEIQTLEVKANHKIEDNYEFTVTYEMPFDEKCATFITPSLEALDVTRQTGFIGVTARGNVEVSTGSELKGVSQVNTMELPGAVRAMSPNPILLGFKYSEAAYALSLNIQRLKDVPIRVASIDKAAVTTVITKEGITLTRAQYEIQNNVKQFLRVAAPDGAEVWSAEVNGKVVKPARDTESNAVLIPLFKSVETNRTLNTFPVNILYKQPSPKIPSFAGAFTIFSPATDIPANNMNWEVFIPEKQQVCWSTGDLSRMQNRGLPMKSAFHEHNTRNLSRVEQQIIPRLKESNNQAKKTEPKQTAPVPQSAPPPANTEVAGTLPVPMDLPLEGIPYSFQRLIVTENEPLTLTFYVYHQRLASFFKCFITFGSLGLGLLLGRLIIRVLKGKVISRREIGVVLLALIIFVVLKTVFGISLMPVIMGIILILPLLWIMPWLRPNIGTDSISSTESIVEN